MVNVESLISEMIEDVKGFDGKDRKSKKNILEAYNAKIEEAEKVNENVVDRVKEKAESFSHKVDICCFLAFIPFVILIHLLKLPSWSYLVCALFIFIVFICTVILGYKHIVNKGIKEENEDFTYRIICALVSQYITENLNKTMYKNCYKKIWEAYEKLQKEGKAEDFEKAIKEVGLREMLENLEAEN
jgi:hypothetical protein